MAIGFAILMMVVMVLSSSLKNNAVTWFDWRHGLLWGIAGYMVFWLAPAIGMPPEIPLAATANLEARQIWWLFAVVFTAAGIGGLAFGKSPWRWMAPVLLLLPHLVGAPHVTGAMFADQPPSSATQLEQLAQQFIAATALANIFFWLSHGLISAWAVRRLLISSGMVSPSSSGIPPHIESTSV
jgi:cobalt transporter subunit CbtA